MISLKSKSKRRLTMFVAVSMLTISLLTSFSSIPQTVSAEKDIAARILCKFEDGKLLANLHSTDYFFYLMRSKSSVATLSGVNSNWLNKLLTVVGFDFNGPNEAVLGREIRPTSIPESSVDDANASAPRVSAFDRFGVSGLNWSSYQGEWKYYHVDVCAEMNQVSPTNYGSFYEGRLEPKSTYNESSTSMDPRSIQFNKGLSGSIGTAAMDVTSNAMFALAKLVVTFTIVFVSLAFTDISTLIGLSANGAAGISASSLFTDLFNTIFSGFIIIFILFTTLHIIYNGLIKRQLRLALNDIIRTISIFIVALVMSFNPGFWVGVPNQIATYGQALILTVMANVYDSSSNSYVSLCSTDVGSINEGVDSNSLLGDDMISSFEKVNKNMQSLIGCQMWEQLLFKPWVKGQFGAEYEDLASSNVGNINGAWTGLGSVPVGDGLTIDNWALFHLSTQTDAHAQVGNSNFPTLVNNVNADWWRIADALSNYEEKEEIESPGTEFETSYMTQIPSEPTKFWQSWIGNNSTERFGTAFIAVVFGILGSIAPLFFSLSSATLGLGITLLMITSPIFLLFGTWAGKGEKIFYGWLSTLINTVIKRIGISILLILSLTMTMNIMNLAYTIGIIKAFILMVIVTAILIKNKDKILDMMASIDLGGSFNPGNVAKRMFDGGKRHSKTVGKVGLATAAGAKAGRKTGQGAIRGARLGAQSQLRNTLYQSQFGMNISRELDFKVKGENQQAQFCSMCYVEIGKNGEEAAFRDDEGAYFCSNCSDEIGEENLDEVVVGKVNKEDPDGPVSITKTRTEIATNNRSYISHKKTRDIMESRVKDDKYYWNNEAVKGMIENNMHRLREDIVVYSNVKFQLGKTARPSAIPEPLHEYIDLVLINKAWAEGRMDVVENTYKKAWGEWYEDNAEYAEGVTKEDIADFKMDLEKFNVDINEAESKALMKDFDSKTNSKNKTIEDIENALKSRETYVYEKGKLKLINKQSDIDKDTPPPPPPERKR